MWLCTNCTVSAHISVFFFVHVCLDVPACSLTKYCTSQSWTRFLESIGGALKAFSMSQNDVLLSVHGSQNHLTLAFFYQLCKLGL